MRGTRYEPSAFQFFVCFSLNAYHGLEGEDFGTTWTNR